VVRRAHAAADVHGAVADASRPAVVAVPGAVVVTRPPGVVGGRREVQAALGRVPTPGALDRRRLRGERADDAAAPGRAGGIWGAALQVDVARRGGGLAVVDDAVVAGPGDARVALARLSWKLVVWEREERGGGR
jgi:hypothetical protein